MLSFFKNLFSKDSNNPYHRYLNFPVTPGVDLFKMFPEEEDRLRHKQLDKSMLDPKFFEFFEQFDMQFPWIEAFYTPPFGKLWIHIDTDGYSDSAKINWSYCKAPGSELRWWVINDEKYLEPIDTQFGMRYHKADEEHCTMVFKREINKPSIVQVGELHSTFNPTPYGRWTLSLSVVDKYSPRRLTFKETCDIFKDYTIS